ncbi:serine hydrolase [Chromatiales bacterium (ex Bugula neritina AB1)]|nr:serine hydrolase [Chromatiales bacterium (ex Bugula neritina AB1)]
MSETANPESVGMSSQRLERLQHWLDQQVSCGRLAGVSAMVGRRGKIAFYGNAGLAERETGRSFQRDTLVRIFSMTKPVTTVAAMMLYEQGCFQLDDSVSQYLSEFADTPVWIGNTASIDAVEKQQNPITIRQLMNHTSGLTYEFLHANPVDNYYRDQGINFQSTEYTLEEMVQKLAAAPLLCQPGSQWNYSVATDVLGRLIEVWSGASLQAFFKERIFEPLQMLDTGFHVEPHKHQRFSAMYGPAGGRGLADVGQSSNGRSGVRQSATNECSTAKAAPGLDLLEPAADNRFLHAASLYSGGGGLTASIDDYARFCQMLLNGGSLDGNRLLSPITVDYMCTNQLRDNRDLAAMGQPVWSETSYEGIGFGLGFAIVLDPVKAHIITSAGEAHWGGAASTFFWIDKKQELFTILFTQLMPSSTYPLRRELRARVYQAIVEATLEVE